MRTAASVGHIGHMGSLEAMLEDAAERMDPGHVVHQALDVLHALPEDVRDLAIEQGKTIFEYRGILWARFVATLTSIFLANPLAWSQIIARNRAAGARQLALAAGRAVGLKPRRVTHPPGMSPVQVRQYGRRQRARGYVPGRQRGGRQREMELEFELGVAANALTAESESPQTNWVYFDSWTSTPTGWKYIARDGSWQMTREQANQMIFTLQLRYRAQASSLGGSQVTVQCYAYFPVSQRWVPCQNWY